MTQRANDISVVICAYTQDRWNDLVAAVESVRRQSIQPREIIVVIDHNPGLLKRAREHLADVVVVENTEARGLRGARNSGVAAAQSGIIAFLDDDAVAIADWLKFLCEGYSDPKVLGTGGEVTPFWEVDKPAWFPEEFYWVVGCTYRGMQQANATVRNPIGANMSFRREVFDTVGDFHSDYRRIGPQHVGGCEETELCIRAHQRWPQHVFLYRPQARVCHHVTRQRTRWHYFFSRCYHEGVAKATLTQYVGAKDSLASERSYTFRALPRGIVHGLADTFFHHDPNGLARSTAIVAGLAVTATGYLMGSILSHVAALNGVRLTTLLRYTPWTARSGKVWSQM